MDKKESRVIRMSVEGINCERLYFKHLAKLINRSGSNMYNLKIDPKVRSPKQYARSIASLPQEKRKNNRKIPFFHIQDIEDYYNDGFRRKFEEVISEMREAEEEWDLSYEMGYSNYTFELWMLLHAADMKYAIRDRYAYLDPINRWFNKRYKDLDEFKAEAEFQSILDQYVTLDSIWKAIKRAEKIKNANKDEGKKTMSYKNVEFYPDNPDLSIHLVVRQILDICGVIKQETPKNLNIS